MITTEIKGTHKEHPCRSIFNQPVPIGPLIILRIGFGVLMLISTLRFMAKGWIREFYVAPEFHFTYAGFGWVAPLSEAGLWAVFVIIAICCIYIILGLFYRPSMITFFILFSYIELLDKSYYLNHYYFVSVFSFILIFLPLNKSHSLDTRFGFTSAKSHVPAWMIWAVRLQIAIVYFYTGVAKVNPDWLFRAQPLTIWLRARTAVWGIGQLFDYRWIAFAMSWSGMLFDLTIPAWLMWRKSRKIAYGVVIVFHTLTAILFNIGMFPWVMITVTLVFFDWEGWSPTNRLPSRLQTQQAPKLILLIVLISQLMLPLRHLAYPGNVNWNEQGFRFAWRVMLVEKTGEVVYTATDPTTEQSWVVLPRDYLTVIQAKQMAFQPDMIVQFAKFIDAQHDADLRITAETNVSWNGRLSQPLIDPQIDLTTLVFSDSHHIIGARLQSP